MHSNNKSNNLERINQVMDYVEQNLEEDLSLHVLAQVACYSPFHFHRIFATISGETLHEFVTRKRIEKIAAYLLRDKSRSIKKLSLQYGFDNPVSFSRAFKKFYGISATELRKLAIGPFNKIIKQKNKAGKETIAIGRYIEQVEKVTKWMKSHAQVKIKILPKRRLACIRNKGAFEEVYFAFDKLKTWAQPLGLLDGQAVKWLMLVHDNPAITQTSNLQQSACLQTDSKWTASGEVGVIQIPKGRYLVGSFELSDHEFKQAWDGMSIWMMDKGYQAKNGYYFELFHSNSLFEKGQKHFVDICIPVE